MKRLGSILIEQGLIDQEQLEFCLSIQSNNRSLRLGKILAEYHFVSDEEIIKNIAIQLGVIHVVNLHDINHEILRLLTIQFCLEYQIVPINYQGNLYLVCAHPEDTRLMDQLYQWVREPYVLGIATERQIHDILHGYQIVHQEQGLINQEEYLNDLLKQALIHQASDIHIESSQRAVEIRLRINGLLRFLKSYPLDHLPQLLNIIFHRCGITSSDFYHFHDARFEHEVGLRKIEIRVSHIPSVKGSCVVMRLLEKNKNIRHLLELGFSQEHWLIIQQVLKKPFGLTLIVGPTGSGKTTSLYSLLNNLKSIHHKIVTIEDPVEMHLALSTQLQLKQSRGIDFSQSIRAFLRHDPDMMLIGEIRDADTASQAFRACMTGHRVFSTLHSTRSLDAILRLKDLGIDESYMVECLDVIIAQRLVRTLCPHCAIKINTDYPPTVHLQRLSLKNQIYQPVGCSKCQGGFNGRTVLVEMLLLTEDIKNALASRDWGHFRRIVQQQQMYTFDQDATRLLNEGITSLDEIMRVIG